MDRSLKYLKEQFPSFTRSYPYYSDFKGKSLEQIFGKELQEAELHEAGYLKSCVLKRTQGKYEVQELPVLAQVSYVNSIVTEDLDADGDLDLVLAGNELYTPIQTGSSDASIGCVLLNDGNGGFDAVAPNIAGLRLDGWVKGMQMLTIGDSWVLFAWRNNTSPIAFKLQ